MTTAFIFPGQGSQHVGMAKDYFRKYKAIFRELFDEANDVLGFNLKQLCFYGPLDQLTATEVTQPAILTVSVGVLRLFVAEGILPDMVAGHSVGQFAALVAAEVVDFADALKIVRKRGQYMSDVKQLGGMVAVVTANERQIDNILSMCDLYDLDFAAYNSLNQVVFSGSIAKIQNLHNQISGIPGVRVFVVR